MAAVFHSAAQPTVLKEEGRVNLILDTQGICLSEDDASINKGFLSSAYPEDDELECIILQ